LDVRRPTSDVHNMADVALFQRFTSDVGRMASDVRRLTSDVKKPRRCYHLRGKTPLLS
jgi:hypothetical protein